MKIFIFALFLLSSLAFGSQKTVVSEDTRKQLGNALAVYEDLHSAFFKQERSKWKELGLKLKRELEKVDSPQIKKLLEFSVKNAGEITGAQDRQADNERLHMISKSLVHILNKYDINSNYREYYCPMVKKTWLQNIKVKQRVNNPYAPEMPYCGSQK